GLNSVGMRRAGMDAATRSAIKQAYKTIYRSGLNTRQAMEQLRQEKQIEEVENIIRFFENSSRGVTDHR
ncbi:MAG: acyl-[acyl-carrier-protein]--UDP-N-acetylglucosamine O-acyltransferase, partial [Candidatus Sedimenticola sp. (ex Thyasira tokunagai)]